MTARRSSILIFLSAIFLVAAQLLAGFEHAEADDAHHDEAECAVCLAAQAAPDPAAPAIEVLPPVAWVAAERTAIAPAELTALTTEIVRARGPPIL